MEKEKAELWISALRSGEFRRGRYRLESQDEFCCLGVASYLAYKAGACERLSERERFGSRWVYGVGEDTSTTGLPKVVHEWLGLKQPFTGNVFFPSSGGSAVGLNDDLYSPEDFSLIADLIEKYWEEL
jgi:hypothetical protein